MKLKFVVVCCFAFFSFTNLQAEADGPDFWKVSNIAAADQLKIHDQPVLNSNVIGDIPPNANCLKNLGCQGGLTLQEYSQLNDQQRESELKRNPRLCKIEYQGISGWVAGDSLAEDGCETAAKDRGSYPLNTSYIVENESVELIDGSAQQPIPGSSTTIKTFAWENQDNPTHADLNNDGHQDAALLLIQNPGGSGTFYYVAAALYTKNTYKGTNAVYLGDRIIPTDIGTSDGKIYVDYLSREDSEPMSTKPSIETRKWFRIQENTLLEDTR